MKHMGVAAVVFALLGAAATGAAAQNVVNPRTATFTASADHAQLTGYVIGYFLPGAGAPVQSADLGLPTPDATQTCTVTINTQPVPFGMGYVARVKAIAAGAESDWSEVSNPFDRKPGPPGKPVVK